MTDELKMDLRALRMRGALDPKRFYKAVDERSKFVQLGTVVEGRGEGNSGRIVRKDRKQTLVDELLSDQKSRRYAKRKYAEIMTAKQSGGKTFRAKQKNKKLPRWAQTGGTKSMRDNGKKNKRS